MSNRFDKILNTHYQGGEKQMAKILIRATAVAQWTTAAKLITL